MHKNGNITSYRYELRVKMDDISQALGISKRTLYETYDNKEQLLLEGVKMDNEQRRQELDDFINEKPRNEIEIMVKFVRMQMAELKDINPLFFRELSRYKLIVAYLDHGEVRPYANGRAEGYQPFVFQGVVAL